MSICINPNDRVWQKVLEISPNPEVAFNVMKGNYDLSKEEEFKNYVFLHVIIRHIIKSI